MENKKSFSILRCILIWVLILLAIIQCTYTSVSADAPFMNYNRNGTILAFGGSQDYSDLVTLNKTTTSLYIYDTVPFASDLSFTFPFYGATRLPQMNFSYPCDVNVSYSLVFNSGNVLPISSTLSDITVLNLGNVDNSTVNYITDMVIDVIPNYTSNTDPNNPVGIWAINNTVSGTMFTINTSYTITVDGSCSSVGTSEESISFDQLRFYRNTSGLYCTADDTDSGLYWDIFEAGASLLNAPLHIESTPSSSLLLSFLQANGTKQGAPQYIDIAIDLPQISKEVSSITSFWNRIISNLNNRIDSLNQLLDEEFTPFNWLINGVDAFLDADFGFGISFGGLIGILIAFAIVFIVLRLWGGG